MSESDPPHTTPDDVRRVLDVDKSRLPDDEIQPDVTAAEEFVAARLADQGLKKRILNEIATLVAADLVYPRVSGSAKGEALSSVSQGDATVSYANSQSVEAIGNSTHWEKAKRLDTSGHLEADRAEFQVF